MTHSLRRARRTYGHRPGRTSPALASALLVAVAALLIACSAPAPTGTPPPVATLPASPTPGATPPAQPPPSQPRPSAGTASPTAPAAGTVRNAAEAAARVIASDPRFAGVQAFSPNVIGASAWYEVEKTADGYRVAITMGWGDCMAGCISRHTWIFEVSADGSIGQPTESGDPFEGGLPLPIGGQGDLDVELVAGPGCAVDPGCGGRPAVNATVHLLDPFGAEVMTLTSDATGHAKGSVPAGTYVVTADPVAAGQTAPEPIAASIPGGQIVYLRLAFDDPAG